MKYLEAACILVLIPVCSLVGILGSVLTMRVVLHRTMRAHLINRCIAALSGIDLLFLATALAHSALSARGVDSLDKPVISESNSTTVTVMRRLLLPSLARASLLVIVIISAERFCAMRKPRHLQAGNSRKSLVYASLSVAAAPFVVYSLELALLAPPHSPQATAPILPQQRARNASTVESRAPPVVTAAASVSSALVFAALDASLRFLPLGGILLLNLGIVRVLKQSFKQRERLLSGFLGIQRALLQPGRLPQNALAVLQRQRKTTCMLVYMSTFHLVLLTPAMFLSVLARARTYRPGVLPGLIPEAGPRELSALIVTLETVSCSFNFALYIRQSEKFRNVLLGMLGARCGARQRD